MVWDITFLCCFGVGNGVGRCDVTLQAVLKVIYVKKCVSLAAVIAACLFLNTGCSVVGNVTVSASTAYGFALVCSAMIFGCYLFYVKRRDVWSLMMFASVLVVNAGYLALSLSKTLDGALMANRVSYLGSALLPLSFIMIILNVSKIKHGRWLYYLLCSITVLVYLVAASPGILDIYYSDVHMQQLNGATVLVKEYGPWHNLYLIYLVSYVAIMIFCIYHAYRHRRLSSPAYGCILLAAVLVNFFVWLLEQFVKTDFELLSISYVVSCLFLMCMHILIQENERKQQLLRSQFEQKLRDMSAEAVTPEKADTGEETTLLVVFLEKLKGLTPKEREIYDCYLSGMTTKEIMEKLAITENTLKYHNKNLYSKLGVSSRKELERIGRSIKE